MKTYKVVIVKLSTLFSLNSQPLLIFYYFEKLLWVIFENKDYRYNYLLNYFLITYTFNLYYQLILMWLLR